MNDMNRSVSLAEMLEARERRALTQKSMCDTYHTPLLCFTMNIPGPVKLSENIRTAFLYGCSRLEEIIMANGFTTVYQTHSIEKTGCEALYCIDSDPLLLKKAVLCLEEEGPYGRIFDLDVLDQTLHKLSREELGLPSRTCMLCGCPAHACSRNRTHNVDQLMTYINSLFL